jgi:predicted transcriptional regulator of viral defense system
MDKISLAKSANNRHSLRVKSRTEHLIARDYVAQLAARGRHHFTSTEARNALDVSANAANKALKRLKDQGALASPEREFYVIVPPEYRALGCLPAEQFIPALMEEKCLSYYAGMLSAAQYYGAAHQRPQQFQVVLARNRRPIACGKVRVSFIARKRIDDVPVKQFNTARGTIHVSTPEATAIDLAGYPTHAGGLSHVATVLSELAEALSPGLLPKAAKTAPGPWGQRLGYLLELVGASEAASALDDYIGANTKEYTLLAPGHDSAGERNARWKIIVNVSVEPDL